MRGPGDDRSVPTAHRLFDAHGVAITDVTCREPAGPGAPDEPAHHAIVFVRRGCFVGRVGGAEHVLDPTRITCIARGDEQRYDHPHDRGDDCTSVRLDPGVLAGPWGGDPTLPPTRSPARPRSTSRTAACSPPPAGATTRRPARRPRPLARRVGPPPQPHVPRRVGHTVARHRMRLRVRLALERLAGGVGFSDQSHLCRVIRRETGHTPAALRRALGRDR